MEHNKIALYQPSLERYVRNASEAQTLTRFRRSLSQILKIGLMEIYATRAVICQYNHDTLESTVIAISNSAKTSSLQEANSDIGVVYDEQTYPHAFVWLAGHNPDSLQVARDSLEKDEAAYHEFVKQSILTALYVPIKVNRMFWGYVEIQESRYPRPFRDDEIALFERIVGYIAEAVAANNPDHLA